MPLYPDAPEHLLNSFILAPELAVEFEVREIYLQTPGPSAGTRLVPPRSHDRPVTTLPSEIRPVLDNGVPSVMVTCSADGIPNVTVISQVYYVDETHVALSFQFFSKTIKNVRENPRAFVCVSDIIGLAHWVLQLEFQRSETEGPIFDAMDMQIEAIASATGMSGIFKLRAADIYRVLSVDKRPYAEGRRPMTTGRETDEVARLSAQLARKTTELQVLQRVSAEINATLDLEEIYDAALRTMGELFEFHHANILLLEPDGEPR